eukprot:TRINITY_DN60316_c0_g1_i1.p1 TRINITY_DN60316_c0_g1~~TRINITY_DN60316_c0_g1_i1.p1  ORF type:complete len:325 (+),score=83.47 TRINITY_DN60316_c0_g1_i1:75-977(+)
MGPRLSRSGETRITLEEVAKHNTKDDAWIIIDGEAIDVTSFIPLHPGGEDNLTMYMGKDATKDWQNIHTAETLEQQLQHLRKMGKVEVSSGLVAWVWSKLSRQEAAPSSMEGSAAGATSSSYYASYMDSSGGATSSTEEPHPAHRMEPVRWSIQAEAELPPGGIFDVNELSRWDGVQLPMCVGICGEVIDVSSSSNFVPGFGYGKLWAGKDTTFAMATVSLKAADANNFDFEMEALSEEQFKALCGWYKHFTDKYRKVGTLREWAHRDFGSVEVTAANMKASSLGAAKEEPPESGNVRSF